MMPEEGLGHVPRPRRHIFAKPVRKTGLPCELPLAVLTLSGSSTSINEIRQDKISSYFIGAGGETRTLNPEGTRF
jgi:hypothetical protein